ncbi:MAG: FprA family A-type flavoprotein [Lachnospiraceae bacterium]|nr:FprA family A-type flavoprotein [Lachnospiraceae bacterium]
MHCTRKVTDDVVWIGGSDRRLALFENIFPIPRGVSYNSYLLKDEKTVLLDTVDRSIAEQFLENLAYALEGRNLDYVIVNHMEPDHCALIRDILVRYPQAQVVGNAKTFTMMDQFFDFDLTGKTVTVKEGDTLETGRHTLSFIMAPMVHWPEAMMTYDTVDKILFSADAFGTFGALNGNIFADELDFERDWLDDARRYYTNIVGKYGAPVQAVLKKATGIEIAVICPLHGPIWRENLSYLLEKYQTWSSYEAEDQAVMIAYASMYGNTENLANVLACRLADAGIRNIAVYDVSNTHVSQLIAESFRCSHIVLAAPTYNGGIYPVMENYLNDMQALAVQKRTFAVLDNGTWASTAGKQMAEKLSGLKDVKILDTKITIKSALKEAQLEQLDALVNEIKADF